MSFSLFFSVLIGVVFTWFLLSIATLNIQEWVASRGKWRARMLSKTIGKMLTDEALLDQFYNHTVIRSLYTGKNNQDKPSYIPSDQFSQVIIDILATMGTEASLMQNQLYQLQGRALKLSGTKRKIATRRINTLMGMTRKALVSEGGEDAVAGILEAVRNDLLSLQTKVHALQDPIDQVFTTVHDQKQEINDALVKLAYQDNSSGNTTINQLRAGIVGLSITHPTLKQTLYTILNTASQTLWQKENELELVRMNIEDWFNNNMTRLTGWYKRRTMISTFFISLMFAVCINVDTINIADRIWNEPELRTLILDQVDGYLTGSNSDIATGEWSGIQEQVNIGVFPIGWIGNLTSMEGAETDYSLNLRKSNCTLQPRKEDQLYGIWIQSHCYELVNAPLLNDTAGWLVKVLGLLVTAIASSQGAPIWFDILKKIVNIRLTGINPSEKKQAAYG
jgi:hypothetical protein